MFIYCPNVLLQPTSGFRPESRLLRFNSEMCQSLSVNAYGVKSADGQSAHGICRAAMREETCIDVKNSTVLLIFNLGPVVWFEARLA